MDSRSINRVKVDINKYISNTKSNEIKTGKSDLLTKKVIIIKTDNKNNVIKNEKNSEIFKVNKNKRNHFIYISKPEYHKEIKPKIEDKVISLRNRLEYKDNCQYKEIKEFKRIETNSKINKKEYNTSYQIKTHSFRNNDKSGITLKDEEKTKTIINSNNNQEVRSQERGNKNIENKEKSSSISTRTIASASNEGRRQIPISKISNESDKNKKSHYQIQNESKFIINKGNKRDIFEDNNGIKKLKDLKPKSSETKEIKITDSIKEHADILRNVKSNYIFKLIFSFVEEKIKLNILKYNKFYHKQLKKTVDDYKNISGRYKKDGINGSGAEYLLNKKILVFKGEYLNGKRNGYGREFENYKMIFEGEYLNGKRNGEGKEYIDRNLIFKGNYLNGKRNGYGREYKNNKLLFEGNYLNGKKNGTGKKYYDNGKLKFEGNYLNGKKWNGKMYGKNCKDVSELKDGKGTIKKYYENGDLKFEGEYLNGKKNGKGKEYEFNEVLFDGEYLNGKRWNGNKIIYNWDLINDCMIHGYNGAPMCFRYYIKYLDGKEQ